ncbi:hypothetical protein E2E76_07760, partial [Salmonella enterica subsp. enterica serovar Weltevreden]
FPVNAWPDWSALSALSKSKGWDMCHSFLIVYYWNDTEFLTLPFGLVSVSLLRKDEPVSMTHKFVW